MQYGYFVDYPPFYLRLFVCFAAQKCLDKSALVWYNNQAVGDNLKHLGVAQLVARYLGVVEAARSSRVTQTSSEVHNEPPNFFYFLANPREILCFRDNDYRHILPFLSGRMCLFLGNDDMFAHRC